MPFIGAQPVDIVLGGGSIGDDIVDSNHYVDGSIDTAHLGDDQVTEAKIANDAIGLAELKAGTDGEIISWDASGNPVAIGAGTAGHFLKSQGAGSQPVFAAASAGFTQGTEQATTSGTSVTFGSIPAGVQMVIINFAGGSMDDNQNWNVQIGDSGGIETSGYTSGGGNISDDAHPAIGATQSDGFHMGVADASTVVAGSMMLTLEDAANYTWCSVHTVYFRSRYNAVGGGFKSLSAELTQLKIAPDSGNFDAGAINIMYL